jgi:hypothetical protein
VCVCVCVCVCVYERESTYYVRDIDIITIIWTCISAGLGRLRTFLPSVPPSPSPTPNYSYLDCTHAHMHKCTYAHMHTCTYHTCTYAHMHTCTHPCAARERALLGLRTSLTRSYLEAQSSKLCLSACLLQQCAIIVRQRDGDEEIGDGMSKWARRRVSFLVSHQV